MSICSETATVEEIGEYIAKAVQDCLE